MKGQTYQKKITRLSAVGFCLEEEENDIPFFFFNQRYLENQYRKGTIGVMSKRSPDDNDESFHRKFSFYKKKSVKNKVNEEEVKK